MSIPIFKNIMALLAVVSLLAAVLLLILPNVLRQINNFSKIWVSTRKFMRPLEIPREVDEQILKRRKILGIIYLLLAIYCLYLFIVN